MKIYNVGTDVPYGLPSEENDGYVWLVYEYRDEGYEGYGEAVMLGIDGLIHIKGLDHCSCYGPFDCWETNLSKMTVDEYCRSKDNVHDYVGSPTIESKVKELLGR